VSTQTLPPPGEFRTTQEIRDANFAARLNRRRRLMFWWSLPVVVIAFLAAVKLISAVIINTAGISAYGNENHNTAAERFGYLDVVNVVEPWKPYFNEGTATYASGDFFGATGPLEDALAQVPTSPEGEPPGEAECAVRTNYSLALEGLGDEAMAAQNPATALDYYSQAQEMLADCAQNPDAPQETQDADERQQESQDEAQEQHEQQQQEQQNGQGDPEDDDTGDPDEQQNGQEDDDQNGQPEDEDEDERDGGGQEEDRDPREEELEERNREAQQEREQQEQQEGGGDGSGQNW